MLYSRLLAPWLLWLVLMLTITTVRTISAEQCLGLSETKSVPTNNSCANINCTFDEPKDSKCSYLTYSVTKEICSNRSIDLSNVYLRHCGRQLSTSLPREPWEEDQCENVLNDLIHNDCCAKKLTDGFQSVLQRFDCPQPYSVKVTCAECKVAYRNWICSDKINYYHKSRRIKPCRSLCRSVEQNCPFFLPLDKAPAHYGGEPTFLCLDPNIEETAEQQENSSYGPDTCCYEDCEDGGPCKVRGGATCSGDDDTQPPTTDNDNSGNDNGAAHLAQTASLAAAIFLAFLLLVNRTRLRVM